MCSVYFVNPTKPNQTLDFGQNVVSSHPKDEHFLTQVSQMSNAKLAWHNKGVQSIHSTYKMHLKNFCRRLFHELHELQLNGLRL